MGTLTRSGVQLGVLGTADLRDPASCAQAMNWLWTQRTFKEPLEARTARNCAFYDGKQFYEWNNKKRQMVLPERYRDRQDWLIYNVIGPLLDQKLAKMSAKEPTWTVPAFTSDPHDQMVARFSNDLLGWYYTFGLGMERLLEKFLRWYFCSPVTFIEAAWDATKGDRVPVALDDFYRDIPEGSDPATSDQMRTDDLSRFRGLIGYQGDEQPVIKYSGDPVVKVRSIFQVVWYPFMLEDWDQCQAYLVTDVMTAEEVSERFRIPVREVLSRKNSRISDTHFNRVLRAWSSPYMDGPGPDIGVEYDTGILVSQLYATRTVCPPRGQDDLGGVAAVWIHGDNETIKPPVPLNNPLGILPLVPAVENPSNGFAWGTCSIDRVIGPQIDLNDSRTQLGRWRKNKSNPKIIVDLNDGGDQTAWLRDDAPYRCHIDKRPQAFFLPQGGFEDREASAFNLQYMHDALAVPDIALGRTDETSVRSGRAVLALQDEASQRLRNIGKGLNRVMSKAGTLVLSLLQAYAIARRVTPIVGQNNIPEFKEWSATKLRPTIYDQYPSQVANVNVTTFTNLPMSPGEMQQTVISLMQTNVIRPGEHDRLIAEVFGLNDFRAVFDRGRLGRDRATMKVERWRKGLPAPPPMETDDHDEHIDIIGQFVDTDDYLALAVNAPQIAQEAHFHLKFHEQAKYDVEAEKVMRLQFAQMRMAAIMAGEAAQAGLAGASMYFSMQANGGIDPAGLQDMGEKSDRQGERKRNEGRPPAAAQRSGKSNPPSHQERRSADVRA
jgi:hypothetical protein